MKRVALSEVKKGLGILTSLDSSEIVILTSYLTRASFQIIIIPLADE
jgi:hypothetical protein